MSRAEIHWSPTSETLLAVSDMMHSRRSISQILHRALHNWRLAQEDDVIG